ncbi:MAG: efflux RND transporter periplasmic adaptor subunit [Verrucomicrobia bacterium]|nr:efflux RND transporter periplasmic adaptor subunit [Verrucomicrobiota bacterium]
MYKIKRNFILLGVILGLTSCHSKKPETGVRPPVPVTAFQIKPQTIPATFEFVGVARSSHPVEIRARVEGYLWSVDYVEGSAVKIGDPLFQLDPRPFIASLEEANGMLAREEAILWRAQKSLDRMAVLFPKNAVSQRDLDDATAAVMAAEASVISAKANVEQAALNLSFTKIVSPIDGLSGRAIYQQGALISPNVNGLLTQVSVIDPIWVLFSVSDNELLLGKGETKKKQLILPSQQEYTVQLELSDGSFFPYKGKLNFTSPTLDPATGSLVVRATFDNPEGLILPGQFVKAYVSGAYRPDAILVPQQSVSQGRDGMYVFVIDKEAKVSLRNIQVGDWFENYWIVKEGLQPGDLVVVEGTNSITEASSVKITAITLPSNPTNPQELKK